MLVQSKKLYISHRSFFSETVKITWSPGVKVKSQQENVVGTMHVSNSWNKQHVNIKKDQKWY